MTGEPLPDAEVYVMTVPDLTERFKHEIRQRWRVEMPGKKLLILGGGTTLAPSSHLDAAWLAALAAIDFDPAYPLHPYGSWRLSLTGPWRMRDGPKYQAIAQPHNATGVGLNTDIEGIGDTPDGALCDLVGRIATVTA